jgi:hypothetical protein
MKVEKIKRGQSHYKFNWEGFDHQAYYIEKHEDFQSAIPLDKRNFYQTSFLTKARLYRMWTQQASILRWKYKSRVLKFNYKLVLPIQKTFDVNAFLLAEDYPTPRIKVVETSPFPRFNRWLRTLLFLHRPTKTLQPIRKNLDFILLLNFKRYRFFPSIRPLGKASFVSLSLGLFRRFTRRSRAWTKTRMSYLLSASFLRKVLMYTTFHSMYLFINRAPKHLNSILHTLQSPALQVYEYPFLNFKLDKSKKKFLYVNNEIQFNTPDSDAPLQVPIIEEFRPYQVQFPFIIFTNSKAYAPTKKKKRGSIKRQNKKKIILLNRIAEYL